MYETYDNSAICAKAPRQPGPIEAGVAALRQAQEETLIAIDRLESRLGIALNAPNATSGQMGQAVPVPAPQCHLVEEVSGAERFERKLAARVSEIMDRLAL